MLEGSDKNSCLLVSFTLGCLTEAAGLHTRPQTKEKGGGQQYWAPARPYSSSCHSLHFPASHSYPLSSKPGPDGLMLDPAGLCSPGQYTSRCQASTPKTPAVPSSRETIPHVPQSGGGSLPMAVVRKETTSDSFPSL